MIKLYKDLRRDVIYGKKEYKRTKFNSKKL